MPSDEQVVNIDSYDHGRPLDGFEPSKGDIHPRNKSLLADRIARQIARLAFGVSDSALRSRGPVPEKAEVGKGGFSPHGCNEVKITFQMNGAKKLDFRDAPFSQIGCSRVLHREWPRSDHLSKISCVWDTCHPDPNAPEYVSFKSCIDGKDKVPAWALEPAYRPGDKAASGLKECSWPAGHPSAYMCRGVKCATPMPFQISPDVDRAWVSDEWYDAMLIAPEAYDKPNELRLFANMPEGKCAKAIRYLVGDIPECVLYGTGKDKGAAGAAARMAAMDSNGGATPAEDTWLPVGPFSMDVGSGLSWR